MEDSNVDPTAWLSERDVILCIRDQEFVIRYQNENWRKCCGNQCGQKCNSFCTSPGVKSANSDNIRNAEFGDRALRLTTLTFGKEILTMGVPTGAVTLLKLCRDKGLSDRETEIAFEIRKGMTNPSIAKKLSISLATLKTHINNLYRKLGTERDQLGRRRRS